ncbi:MAG: DUF2807 domain-containing protein [Bacteroidota bacterium]
MKTLLTSLLISISIMAFGQKPIKGKGEIKTKQFDIEQFTKLQVNFGGNIKIECGKMPQVVVKANENILPLIKVQEKQGTLYIGSDEWIENATRDIVIHVPFLHEYIHSGWGRVDVTNLNSEHFTIEASSGSIYLEGEVDLLKVKNTGSGSIKLKGLKNRYLEVYQTGSSSLNVFASDTVFIERNEGVIVYAGEPVIIKADDLDDGMVQSQSDFERSNNDPIYIDAKVKNNSDEKRDYFIKGPANASFSYGFPMKPGSSRAERVPVGTKIYQVNALGMKTKLLVEFTASDDGETIKLYK